MSEMLWEWALLALYGFAAVQLGRAWQARRAQKMERRALQKAAQTWGRAEGRRG
jgi:hypothetical protein